MDTSFLDGIDAAITVCDTEGVITYMNERSARMFKEQGGLALVGKSLFDCHDEKANEMIRRIMREHAPNAYTIEKNGKKKLVWQSPWEKDGKFAGLIEIVLPIPFEMPHFLRK